MPPTQFPAGCPTGSDSDALPFAVRGVTITQSFDRDRANLKASEAPVRTVVVFAGNTQAMMIPPRPSSYARSSGAGDRDDAKQAGAARHAPHDARKFTTRVES
ncbi:MULTISPECIES: hypothetical protein [Rhizobium]|uniref:Uncharacterized protein n=1 Tax=Rhizobium favelukesii TaxID=348824 RepID=W6RD24_9HYPH|nr:MULTISPECIES: hypothetical protein [Rhizobium]MCA0802811.1 hypothetical protein [Rhizobium sp. T1473]MCS0462663.1 hypothetical protein [Rhizobium favelukesii]UFS83622.1 hypothetical protein LPB79_15570 [Rhizobium sp. T136]CDM58769.1 hypothetical protein LPU83_3119 [Rhizobium favelukesii]